MGCAAVAPGEINTLLERSHQVPGSRMTHIDHPGTCNWVARGCRRPQLNHKIQCLAGFQPRREAVCKFRVLLEVPDPKMPNPNVAIR